MWSGNGIRLNFVQLKGWYYLQYFLDKTYIRFDFKNSVKARQKTNLKVLLINNVVREKEYSDDL